MDYESSSSRYVSSRLSLWCPICGARENQGCKVKPGILFDSHNAIVLGTVPRPVIGVEVDYTPRLAPKDRPKWNPKTWTN